MKHKLKVPGSVGQDTAAMNMYKRCSDVCHMTIILLTLNSQISIQLAGARVQTLVLHSFNLWTIALAEENDVHSDDKLRSPPPPAALGSASSSAVGAASSSASAVVSSTAIYDIRWKAGQSTKVKKFFWMLDVVQAQSNLHLKSRYHRWAAPPILVPHFLTMS